MIESFHADSVIKKNLNAVIFHAEIKVTMVPIQMSFKWELEREGV